MRGGCLEGMLGGGIARDRSLRSRGDQVMRWSGHGVQGRESGSR